MSNLMLDVNQAAELKAAFRRGNWTNAEIKQLCEGNTLAQFREVLLGHASIERFIDCDMPPSVPADNWIVEEHRKGGVLRWDASAVRLGNFSDESALNANVLDYLLAHPHLIPEEWESKKVVFLGTIYRRTSDDWLLARYLFNRGYGWETGIFQGIGTLHGDEYSVAVRSHKVV